MRACSLPLGCYRNPRRRIWVLCCTQRHIKADLWFVQGAAGKKLYAPLLRLPRFTRHTYSLTELDYLCGNQIEGPVKIAGPGVTKIYYSTISRTYLFRVFPPAALKIALNACTFRPCLPIIFPISDFATLSSNTLVLLPSISVIDTSSG